MKDILECYKTLGLEPGAAPERVRNAYLQLARFYDPERYIGGDPDALSKAEQKRKEVELAYLEIRHFLPTQNREASDDGMQGRDFKEMADAGPSEISHTLVALILGGVMALILGWGYYLYQKSVDMPSSRGAFVDPESSAPPSSSANPSTGSLSAVPSE